MTRDARRAAIISTEPPSLGRVEVRMTARQTQRARFISLLCIMVAACLPTPEQPSPEQAQQESRTQAVVYGEDNRLDWFELQQEQQTLVRESIGVLVHPDDIDDSDPEHIRLSGQLLGESKNLCEDEAFASQPSVGRCSATLIDDDLALTAGHCLPGQRRCANRRLVFDFYYEAEDQLATISATDVYRCEALLASVDMDDGEDFAIFQLDRPVDAQRRPVTVQALDDPLPLETPVALVGFPNGIPAKWAAGGRVTRAREDQLDFFEATVDAFSGNSGAGVFDAAQRLIGVLVRGRTDYIIEEDNACFVVNTLPATEENAEDITYVGRAIEALCRQGWESSRLCQTQTRGLCFPCSDEGQCRVGWRCDGDTPELSTCAPPCTEDSDCRADHTCNARGVCSPRLSQRCLGDEVWSVDGCERQLARVERCDEGQFCAQGQCLTPGEGDTCDTAVDITPVTQTLQQQLSLNHRRQHVSSCASQGVDRHYRFALTAPTRLIATISTETEGFEPTLSLRSECDVPDSELGCTESPDVLDLELTAGSYTLIVDAQTTTTGDFELSLEFESLCPEPGCEPGIGRCLGERLRATCVLDAQGCPHFADVTGCPDGQVCIDTECRDPIAGDSCDDPVVLSPISQRLVGDLESARSTIATSCGSDGVDIVYSMTLEAATALRATLSGEVADASLTLLPTCDASASAQQCATRLEREGLTFEGELAAGTWLLVVDLGEEAVSRTFALDLEVSPACVDACNAGEVRCASEMTPSRCEQDQRGCLQWVEGDRCADNTQCQAGVCLSSCSDSCELEGEQRCDGLGSVQTCQQDPDGRCLSWSASTLCQPNTTCDIGRCQAPQTVASSRDSGCQTTPQGQSIPRKPNALSVLFLMAMLAIAHRIYTQR